ncbi:hypothetical protein GCM10027346_29570 [Hymenobacter seoulensis]
MFDDFQIGSKKEPNVQRTGKVSGGLEWNVKMDKLVSHTFLMLNAYYKAGSTKSFEVLFELRQAPRAPLKQ